MEGVIIEHDSRYLTLCAYFFDDMFAKLHKSLGSVFT